MLTETVYKISAPKRIKIVTGKEIAKKKKTPEKRLQRSPIL